MSEVRIEHSLSEDGETVLTAWIPIPDGVDPEWFASFAERAIACEIGKVIGLARDPDDDAGYALPDEFDDDDGVCDFTAGDVIT